MAVYGATPKKCNFNEITDIAFEAATVAKDGIQFKLPNSTDEYLVIVVQNTSASAATITLKKPTNGSYAASGSDEVHSLAASGFAVIRIESARFANTDGTVLLVPSDVAVKVAVIY